MQAACQDTTPKFKRCVLFTESQTSLGATQATAGSEVVSGLAWRGSAPEYFSGWTVQEDALSSLWIKPQHYLILRKTKLPKKRQFL